MPGEVVWQDYNPYPKFQGRELGPELVFVRDDMPEQQGSRSTAEEPVVSHFEEVLFPYPTGISQKIGAKLKFTELVSTADEQSGTIDVNELQADRMRPLRAGRRSAASQPSAATRWPPGFAAKRRRRQAGGDEGVKAKPRTTAKTDCESHRVEGRKRRSATSKAKAPRLPRSPARDQRDLRRRYRRAEQRVRADAERAEHDGRRTSASTTCRSCAT